MVIFFGRKTKIAINSSRVFKIVLENNEIEIFYECGEITYLSESGDSVAPKIESGKMIYENEEIAADVMRAFYVAAAECKGAFYF